MQSTLDVQQTSSGSFPRGHRFSYWADVVAQTFVPLQCDTADRDSFFGELRHRQIGLVGVTEVRAAAMTARRTKAKIASAPRDDTIVVLQDAGCAMPGRERRPLSCSPAKAPSSPPMSRIFLISRTRFDNSF